MNPRHAAPILLALAATAAQAAPSPVVRVDTGAVRGAGNATTEHFLGIPYARPPLGALRWRAPQPATRWTATRTATAYSPDCMQEPFPSDAAPLGTKPAEDCLTVNVWRPAGARPGAKLPVLVWIYGGGNVNGGASPAVYSGEQFARDGVIMVSYNWRVGRFGFFAHPELTRVNADKGLLANYGFMDSIAALKWVRRNVAAFGGDPAKVTIYGQSAGAGQVAILLTTPLARGLFSRAIIQSGGGNATPRPPLAEAEKTGIAFAKRWGIEGTGPDALARMRALSAAQVTDGIHIGTSASQREIFSGTVTDGKLLPETLTAAVEGAREARVPLIIGSTTADNYSSMTAKTIDEALATTFKADADQARRAYLTDPQADPAHVLREMGRDMSYAEPARYLATRMRAQGVPVYLYRFAYVADSMRGEWVEGPPHATDIPYAMETVKAKYGDKLTAQDLAAAKLYHRYWVNFVRRGDPNGAGLPRWPAYDPAKDEILMFKADATAAAMPDPNRARIDAVARVRGH